MLATSQIRPARAGSKVAVYGISELRKVSRLSRVGKYFISLLPVINSRDGKPVAFVTAATILVASRAGGITGPQTVSYLPWELSNPHPSSPYTMVDRRCLQWMTSLSFCATSSEAGSMHVPQTRFVVALSMTVRILVERRPLSPRGDWGFKLRFF